MSKEKQKSIEELLEEALVPEEERPYNVPENWVWIRFGYVAKLFNGYAFKSTDYSNEGIPIIRISDLNGIHTTPETAVRVPKELYNEKFLIRKGDLLIAMSGATTGKIGIYNSDENAMQNQRVGNIKTINDSVLYSKYRNYFVINSSEKILKLAYGGAQPNISGTLIENLAFPLPPIHEQKRIAEKVERLLAKIDEAKRLIEEVKESIELRRTAILDKAFKGQLGTNDPNEKSMLETSNNINEKDLIPKEEQPYEVPENWVWVRLEAAKKDEQGFGDGDWILSKHIDSNGSVRLIQLSDIGVGEFLNKSNKYITDKTFEELECTEILPGDILISRMADPIARSCIVPDLNQKLITAVDIAFLRVNEKIYNKKFLNYLFNTKSFKRRAERLARGTTRLRITRKNLANLPIPMPPVHEQKRIAEKVDNLLSKLDNEKEKVLEVEEKLNLLKQSILNKAFRGELGTNVPNDEHAIELLKEVLKSKSK